MQPFSIRHGKALLEQRIRVSMKDRLRAPVDDHPKIQ
jgi:hypothetical protein